LKSWQSKIDHAEIFSRSRNSLLGQIQKDMVEIEICYFRKCVVNLLRSISHDKCFFFLYKSVNLFQVRACKYLLRENGDVLNYYNILLITDRPSSKTVMRWWQSKLDERIRTLPIYFSLLQSRKLGIWIHRTFGPVNCEELQDRTRFYRTDNKIMIFF
jgi:hypothetical protein